MSTPAPTDESTSVPEATPTPDPTSTPEPTPARRVVGDSVTYEGLEATVVEYTTVDRIDGGSYGETHLAGDASEILLARVTVENVGDIRRTPPYTQDGSLYLIYQGAERGPLQLSGEFDAGGKTRQAYGAVEGQREGLAIYPGATAYGWAAFEVESAFDETNTAIVCGLASDELYKKFRWYLG